MTVTWESFSEALGDDGLVHVVKQGDKNSLCGKQVRSGDTEGGQACLACHRLRGEAIDELPGDGA